MQALQERLRHAIEISPDQQSKFVKIAQVKGVSLNVARRVLRVVAGSKSIPAMASLGRATLEGGVRAASSLTVLDEASRPRVKHGIADEILGSSGWSGARFSRMNQKT